MTPKDLLLDIHDLWLPELWAKDEASQLRLTKLKGVLQFSEVLVLGLSIWKPDLSRTDEFIKNTNGIGQYRARLETTPYYSYVADHNSFITGAEFHLFKEPAKAAIWTFSRPKLQPVNPKELTFSIFEVYE